MGPNSAFVKADENDDENDDQGDGDPESEDPLLQQQPSASRQSFREDQLRRRQQQNQTGKRRRQPGNSLSVSEEEIPIFSTPEAVEPTIANPAAHISVRDLQLSLIDGELAGPGKGWLRIPVGLFTKDPFDFEDRQTLEQRLPFYRVVFANFTTGVMVRWNVGWINIQGEVPAAIRKKRVRAKNCGTKFVSFFRNHAILLSLKGKEVTAYLYSWMRAR